MPDAAVTAVRDDDARPPRAPRAARQVRDLSGAEFERLAGFIHEVAGIAMHESKRPLLARRLHARVAELGLSSFAAYHQLVLEDAPGTELVHLLDLVTTNETHFFREPVHFAFLEERLIPRWRREADAGTRSRQVRVWSAACSTGQEPYSLAMQLLWHLPAAEGWEVVIEASDLSTRVLDAARTAVWPIERAGEIPEGFRKRFMLRGIGAQIGRMCAIDALRGAVRFTRVNLNDDRYPIAGSFDLIFCRNVLIYFSAARRAAVVDRLADRLGPGGHLFLGHAESLHGQRARLRAVIPTVYTREPA